MKMDIEMNVFLISEDVFLHEGLKEIVKKEYGILVRLITIDFLMKYCDVGSIKDNDIFLVATNTLGAGISALVILDFYSANTILLDCNRNMSKVWHHSFLPLSGKLNAECIIRSIDNLMLSKLPKIWSLSYKETAVLSYRLRGMSVQSVNKLLSINTKTVYTHQRNGLMKMGVKSFSNLYRIGWLYNNHYRYNFLL